MSRLIGEHNEGDVRVRFHEQGDELIVERQQDAQPVLDMVAAVNSEGAPTIDGLGKPVCDVPTIIWVDWCLKRGLDWEKLFSTDELDAEFKRCAAAHSRLCYKSAKSLHTVAA